MQRELIIEKFSYIDGKSIFFDKYRDDNLIKKVRIHTLVKELNGFKYIVILNSYEKTIFEAYKYLNDEMNNANWKKREKSMHSLKLLFSFVEVFKHNYNYLDK